MNDKLTKPTEPSHSLVGGKLRATQTPFQQRVKQAQVDVFTLPNRLILCLDVSGSMRGSKIDNLKQAVENFVQRCDEATTALGLRTFGRDGEELELHLTTQYFLINSCVLSLSAQGGTPLWTCLKKVITDDPATRVVLISDGSPTDYEPESLLGSFKEASVPIDCVHIGDSVSGEETLKRIAEETGGLYIKFTNTNALTSGLSYLTPSYRGLLASGQVDAAKLGAKEVK
jgi:Mg-chelatase subunit ChlD